MDRSAAITVARALIEEMDIQPGELFPEVEAVAPTSDIDALLPRRRWVPKAKDDSYWCVQMNGEAGLCLWDGNKFEAAMLEAGNVFPSRKDAEEHAANIRAWVELRERSDKVRDGWIVEGGNVCVIPGVGFSSPHLRSAVINHIGQDRIDALARWIWGIE